MLKIKFVSMNEFKKELESGHKCFWCNRFFPDKILNVYGCGFLCDYCMKHAEDFVFDILDEFAYSDA